MAEEGEEGLGVALVGGCVGVVVGEVDVVLAGRLAGEGRGGVEVFEVMVAGEGMDEEVGTAAGTGEVDGDEGDLGLGLELVELFEEAGEVAAVFAGQAGGETGVGEFLV